MCKYLSVCRTALALMLAAGLQMECQLAWAWPDKDKQEEKTDKSGNDPMVFSLPSFKLPVNSFGANSQTGTAAPPVSHEADQQQVTPHAPSQAQAAMPDMNAAQSQETGQSSGASGVNAPVENTAPPPQQTTGMKGKEAEPSIPGANPDDANKHPAWRKREADKSIGNMQNVRRSLIQQGNQ